MTLRVALVLEGNSTGAEQAVDRTRDAMGRFVKQTDQASAAGRELTAVSHGEQAALTGVTAATRANTAAVQANNAASRQAIAQRTNLIFQLNDIFVSLASGQNLGMVAIQQGSQISTIYGPGGMGKALSETGKLAAGAATKFAPLLAIAAVAAVGIAGLTHEINRSGNAVQVSFGDVALGVLQTFGDFLYSFVKPVVDAVAGWFTDNWATISQITADLFNFLARGFASFGEDIRFLFAGLPPFFTIIGEGMAKAFLVPVQFMIDKTVEGLNGLVDFANLFGAGLQKLDGLKVEVDFGGAAASKQLEALAAEHRKNIAEIMGTDYATEFVGNVASHARKNAVADDKPKKKGKESDYAREISSIRERTAAMQIESNVIGLGTFAAERMRKTMELENAARKDAIGLTPARVAEIQKEATAYANMAASLELVQGAYDFGKQTFNSFWSDLKGNLKEGQSGWEAFANAGVGALERLADKALSMAADGLWDMIFGALLGAFKPAGTSAVTSLIPGIGGIGRNAEGTNNWRGGLTWVGERGPELLNLPGGSQIIPNGESMAMMRGGGAGGGSFVFAPTNSFSLTGGSADIPTFERMLDERDRVLASQFEDRIASYLANPMRKAS